MVVEAIDFGVKLFNDTIVLCIHIFKDIQCHVVKNTLLQTAFSGRINCKLHTT